MNSGKKIIGLSQVPPIIKKFRKEGKRIGFVEGVFDVLHLGHIELMEFAKKYCDILVVGVASDAYARSTKGAGRPIFKQLIRSKVLAALSATDFILKEDNPPAILEAKDAEKYLHKVTKVLNPDVIISSGATDRNPGAKRARAREIGAKFIIQKASRSDKNASTTQILALLNDRSSNNQKSIPGGSRRVTGLKH